MEQLERVQKLATKWILGTSSHYKERLQKLNLLPLSLYIELHDILVLLALLENKYDVSLGGECFKNVLKHCHKKLF